MFSSHSLFPYFFLQSHQRNRSKLRAPEIGRNLGEKWETSQLGCSICKSPSWHHPTGGLFLHFHSYCREQRWSWLISPPLSDRENRNSGSSISLNTFTPRDVALITTSSSTFSGFGVSCWSSGEKMTLINSSLSLISAPWDFGMQPLHRISSQTSP